MDVKDRSNNNKLYESDIAMQVIGSIFTKPSLLDEDGKYFFSEQDFVTEFHRVAFGTLYNLHIMGSNRITSIEIDAYLKDRPHDRGIYESGGGFTKIAEIAEKCNLESFDYYYNRLKKMSLLRGYDAIGMDVSFIYDPDNLIDPYKRKEQEDKFDSYTLNDIAQIIEDKIEVVKRSRIDNATDEAEHIGDNIFELLEDLEKTPEIGAPLYGKYINGITRGARLGKFYIRSAPTGVGKTRTMIADACYIACDKMWIDGEWVTICGGVKQPTLFISTELDMQEVQTMALAFISGVNEEHILKAKCDFNEKERVREAAKILSESPLFIETIPDFSLKDIENIIKRNIRLNHTQYVFNEGLCNTFPAHHRGIYTFNK